MASNDIRSLTKRCYTGNHDTQLRSVTSFSDQSEGDSKIPSVIYYDLDDYASPKAIGATAMKNEVICKAEEQGWFRCEHFKMYLRPPGQTLKTNGLMIGRLPPNRTAEEVMGDFLRYLMDETGRYISRSHAETDCGDLWQQVKDEAIYVLGHPNGWSGHSQQRYRASAIMGGLIPDTVEGHKRIKFVTEGEASALSCLAGGCGPTTIKKGFRFIITDAGGGTADMTTFEVIGTSPLQLRECARPDCRFAGSVFVNMRGKELLQRKLANSKYDDEDTLDGLITENFEPTVKRQFDGEEDGLLRIGGRREKNEALGISGGFLRLQRDELAACFDNCIAEIVDSIQGQFAASESNTRTTPVWLVGGFGSSKYLLRELKRAFEQNGTTIRTPDANRSKAVADGAVLHYLDGPVRSRVCPTSYVTTCNTRFDPLRPDHRSRPELIERRMSGTFIGPIVDVIAEKGTSVDSGKTFAESYAQKFFSKDRARHYSTELLCYDDDLPVPYWYNENKEKFRTICRLEADLSSLCREPNRSSNLLEVFMAPILGPYWNVSFDIELKFGTTEVEARIKWEDKGVRMYGPVKIIWLE